MYTLIIEVCSSQPSSSSDLEADVHPHYRSEDDDGCDEQTSIMRVYISF
jgi:hypothetical protein